MCRRGKKGFWIAVPARGARLGGNPKTFIKVQQKMSVFFRKNSVAYWFDGEGETWYNGSVILSDCCN